jgi:hypothetical protein
MPDSFEHTPTVSIRIPNGAFTSLAGNADLHPSDRGRRSHRGMTLKTLLGLENERKAFERYRRIRQAERVYI